MRVIFSYFKQTSKRYLIFSAMQEQREFEAIAHVRDSVQMVENAILERDQVILNVDLVIS